MKKKAFVIAILLLITLSMTACINGEQKEAATNTKNQILLNSGSMFIYTFQDSETGVWCISSGKGVTPRLNADGSLYITNRE